MSDKVKVANAMESRWKSEPAKNATVGGDVTAAIERLQERLPLWRLRGWSTADVGVEEVGALLAEVERLRAERDEARATKDMHKERQESMVLELDSLRAEREALHSDETYQRIGATLYGDEWHTPHIGSHDIRDQTVRRVLSVLAADPEETR